MMDKETKEKKNNITRYGVDELVNGILNTTDGVELKKYSDLFRLASAKKELIRTVKLTELMDNVEDLINNVVEAEGNKLEVNDILNIYKALQTSIDRSNKMFEVIDDKAEIIANISIQLEDNETKSKFNSRQRDNIRTSVDTLLRAIKSGEVIDIKTKEIEYAEEVNESEVETKQFLKED